MPPFSTDASPKDVLAFIVGQLEQGQDVCVATVIAHQGSSPSRAGQKLAVTASGTALGTIGGGAVELEVGRIMGKLLEQKKGEPSVVSYDLLRDLDMACGGAVQILIEPMWSATSVLLVGAGHVGTALAKVLRSLDFRVVLTDERPAAASADRASELKEIRLLLGPPDLAEGLLGASSAVVVATHDHELDFLGVKWALEHELSYVGGIGSKSKAAKIRRRLREAGLSDELIGRLRMPVGLDIAASTPEEIAISIAAELIAWRAESRSN